MLSKQTQVLNQSVVCSELQQCMQSYLAVVKWMEPDSSMCYFKVTALKVAA